MRIPSLTHRSHRHPESAEDTTSGPDERSTAQPGPAGAEAENRARAGTLSVRRQRDEREPYHSRHGADDTAPRPAGGPNVAEAPAAMPRPRSSGLATIGLVLGVVAALAVLTGVLAAPGVVVGVLALAFGIGGVSATSRRHVAGRLEALAAIVLGIGAIVVGVLALSGTLSWLSADTNQVTELRDWLYRELPWLDNL